jgi:hypothetical protein
MKKEKHLLVIGVYYAKSPFFHFLKIVMGLTHTQFTGTSTILYRLGQQGYRAFFTEH